ncbi:hypothetical protein [Planococcus sp. CAU13]|uniref:hypothetical protein n=1 Tax=Planococcus sp. CAU13 TaxID=1541197 RepID=UPI00052FFB5A|nr:hypothetical protein [Planococcus sp. CAU13]
MKKVSCLFILLFASALLFGCQPTNEVIKAEEPTHETEPFLSESLLEIAETAKVEVTKKKGVDAVIYEEADDITSFDAIFSSTTKEPGIVNMSAPTLYLKVSDTEGNEQYLQLWIGNEDEQASLMWEDDTHTVYSLTVEMTEKLAGLLEKEA